MDQKEWGQLTQNEKIEDLRRDVKRIFTELNQRRAADLALEQGISELHWKLERLGWKDEEDSEEG